MQENLYKVCYNFLMHEKKQYVHAIDLLRVLAILAVVFIHTTTRTMEAVNFDLQRIPWTFFFNQVSRFAVPLFFMISGFVLELNYHLNESYKTYLKKRLIRIALPYIVWSTIYNLFVFKHPMTDFFPSLLLGTASYQLYFIPTLMIFYLVFPLIHKYYSILSRKWLFIALGVIQLIFLSYDYYIHTLPFVRPISIVLLNFYIFFLGAFASHHKDKFWALKKQWKAILFLLTIAVTIFVSFEGKLLYAMTHNYLSYYSQWRPSIVIYTILLAYSLYCMFGQRLGKLAIIKKLADLSFFVYLIHVLILELLWRWIGESLFTQTQTHIAETFWYDPLFFIIVAGISFIIGYMLHKIPKLAKILG